MSEEMQAMDPVTPDSNPDSTSASTPDSTSASTSDSTEKICPVCGVTIIPRFGGDRVIFSAGPEGTRAKLWARVCQYANKPNCINRDKTSIGTVTEKDYFRAEIGANPGGSPGANS